MDIISDGIRVVGKGSLKEREVGKNQVKLKRTERSWNEPIEVGKFELKLESSG